MDKVGNVINDPINGNLVTLESLEGTKIWLSCVIIDEVGRGCIDLGGDAVAKPKAAQKKESINAIDLGDLFAKLLRARGIPTENTPPTAFP